MFYEVLYFQGGIYYFWEHSIDRPGTLRRLLQTFIDATYIWPVIFTGCHVSRDHLTLIKTSGFTDVKGEPFLIPDVGMEWLGFFKCLWYFIKSHQRGQAVK